MFTLIDAQTDKHLTPAYSLGDVSEAMTFRSRAAAEEFAAMVGGNFQVHVNACVTSDAKFWAELFARKVR